MKTTIEIRQPNTNAYKGTPVARACQALAGHHHPSMSYEATI